MSARNVVFFRVSYLTYLKCGYKDVNLPAQLKMETAYILVGDRCSQNCLFCSFSLPNRDKRKKWLSRISWIEVDSEEFKEKSKGKFSRFCFQLSHSQEAVNFLKEYLKNNDFPQISISAWLSPRELDFFLSLGVDKVALNLDVVGKNHSLIKGGDYQKKLSYLLKMAQKYPQKITTHLIVGCGETEQELIESISNLIEAGVTVSLFPYTKFEKIKLSSKEESLMARPQLMRYRLFQLFHFLKVFYPQSDDWKLEWQGENIKRFILSSNLSDKLLTSSNCLFMTLGCSHCTRPYYNDKPSQKELYNYHYPLSFEEKKQIFTTLLSSSSLVII